MKCKTWYNLATPWNNSLWLTHRNHLSKTETINIKNHWQISYLDNGISSAKIHLVASKDSRVLFARGNEWREVVRIVLKLERVQAVKILSKYLWNPHLQILSNSLKIHRIKQMSIIWVLTLLLYHYNWNKK